MEKTHLMTSIKHKPDHCGRQHRWHVLRAKLSLVKLMIAIGEGPPA